MTRRFCAAGDHIITEQYSRLCERGSRRGFIVSANSNFHSEQSSLAVYAAMEPKHPERTAESHYIFRCVCWQQRYASVAAKQRKSDLAVNFSESVQAWRTDH